MRLKRILQVAGLALLAAVGIRYLTGQSHDVYLAQVQAGLGDGSSCGNARPAFYFNNSLNWGTGPTQIGQGSTVHLCGSIATALIAPTSQGTGLITIFFEPGAKLSQAAGTQFITFGPSSNQWLVDGGSLCGPQISTNGADVACNGVIENTDNGTNKNNQVFNIIAINHAQMTGALEVRGLEIRNLYVHTPPVFFSSLSSNGTNQVTGVCVGPCGFVANETFLTVQDSTQAAYNVARGLSAGNPTGGLTVVSVNGSNIVLQYPTTISAPTDTSGLANIVDGIVPTTSVNCLHASTNVVLASVWFHDSICHDVSWGLNENCATSTPPGTVLEFGPGLDIYHASHGLSWGGNNINQTCVQKFHDSQWHDPTNWNTGPLAGDLNAYHFDGVHMLSGSQLSASKVMLYNLKFYGAATGNGTSFIFNQGEVVHLRAFNNVFICDPSLNCLDAPPLQEEGGGTDELVANNTYIGSFVSKFTGAFNNANSDAYFQELTGGLATGGVSRMNNLISGTWTAMSVAGNPSYAANGATTGQHHNHYEDCLGAGNCFNWNGSLFSPANFAGWLAASGEDGTTSTYDATPHVTLTLGPTYGQPTAGSKALGGGANLTALCQADPALLPLCSGTTAGNSLAAVPRSPTANWDAGAFQSGSTLTPPTNLKAIPLNKPAGD